MKAVQRLRSRGASLRLIRKAADRLRAWGADISNARLYWDGKDVLVQTTDGNFVSGVQQPGQLVWPIATLPLDTWREWAQRKAHHVDLDELRQRDERRRQRRLGEAVAVERLIPDPTGAAKQV